MVDWPQVLFSALGFDIDPLGTNKDPTAATKRALNRKILIWFDNTFTE